MAGNHARRSYLKALGVAAVSLGSAGTASAAPETVVVPDDESTIQAGVDAVAAGGTVEVRSTGSPYTGRVDVGKPVTIIGDPGDDTPGAGSDAPVLEGSGASREVAFKLYRAGVSPDDVTIRGFVMRSYGSKPEEGGWGHGVSAGEENQGITVQDCTVRDMGASGVSVTSWGDRAYRDWTVERCRFENCPVAGVRLDQVSDAVVRNNEFQNQSPVPDTYPRIGVYLHANTRDGESGTQSNVEVANNSFRGDSNRAAVWLLAINKNAKNSRTNATLRGVTVADNDFTELPETTAIGAAANSIRGANTRLESISITGNTVQGAKDGIDVNSAAVEGVAGVTVAENNVQAGRNGFHIRGSAPAAVTHVVSRGNTYDTGVAGVFLPLHDRDGPAGDERYAVDDVRVVEDTVDAGDHWGVGVHANQSHSLGSLTVEGVDSTGKEGVHASGHAPDAVGSVTISDSRFVGHEGPGIHLSGEVPEPASPDSPYLGAVSVTDCSAVDSREQAPGLAMTGKHGGPDTPGVGEVAVDGLTVEAGPGVGVFGHGPDGLGSIEFTGVRCSGLGGIDISGRAPGSIHEVSVDGITVDASEGQGVNVIGNHEAGSTGGRPAVGPVSVGDADFTISEGAALGVHGDAPNALAGVDVQDLTVDATDVSWGGVGVLVDGTAANSIGSVTVEDATLQTHGPGVLVNTEDGADAGVDLIGSGLTIESDKTAVQLRGEAPGAIDSIDLSDVLVEAGGNGLSINGQATDAIGTVALSSLDVTSVREAVYIAADAGSIDTISLEEFVGAREQYATIRALAGGEDAIGSLSADDLTLHDGWLGLWLVSEHTAGFGQVNVTDSDIRRNEYGVATSGELSGDVVRIRGTNFVDNDKPPASEYVGFGVANFSSGDGVIDAKQNYWGHPSGPERPHPSQTNGNAGGAGNGKEKGHDKENGVEKRREPPQTNGKGDRVTENVAYRPWLKQEA